MNFFFFFVRHLMGEQLESLPLKELQQLEQQLDNSLRRIRSRKVVYSSKLIVYILFKCCKTISLCILIMSEVYIIS